jgi:hypothetical protein
VRFLSGAAAAFGLCRCSAFIIAICGIIGLPPCSPTSIRTWIGGGNFALDFRQLDDVFRRVVERHQRRRGVFHVGGMISAPAVIASDQRFEFFGTAAAAARSEDRQGVRLRCRVVAELFRVPPLGNACKRSRRPTQKSRDVAAMINIAARKQRSTWRDRPSRGWSVPSWKFNPATRGAGSLRSSPRTSRPDRRKNPTPVA